MRACITELLRTTHHPSALLLRVERVVQQPVEAEVQLGQATRLYLTDDQLVIQGLIAPSLRLEVEVGDVLDIRRFEVRKAPRKSRAGHILYLAIQDCDLLPRGGHSEDNESEGGGFLHEISPADTSPGPSTRKRCYSEMAAAISSTSLPAASNRGEQTTDFQKSHQQTSQSASQGPSSSQSSSSSSDFETTTPNAAVTQQRRETLRQLHASTSPYFDPSTSVSTPKPRQPSRFTLTDKSLPTPSSPSSQPTNSPPRSPAKPTLNITSLANLPLLPPSTPTTILAIITWTSQSLIRPSPAFPPKRHVKLHDLSLSTVFTGVTLANFIDAANFKPSRGTVVLLRGVVVQRCGVGGGGGGGGDGGKDGREAELADVSRNYMLNAYANLPGKLREQDREAKDSGGADAVAGRETEGSEELGWYVDDEDTLMRLGLSEKVQALKDWWEERQARRTGGQNSAAAAG